jgi:hypothetical protein
MDDNLSPDEKIFPPGSGRSLTRREWVQRMLAGAGAGIAAPALAEARGAAVVAPTGANTETAGEWKPAFFDDPQNQSLIALAERIVPGATGVRVNRFLDTAISAVTQETQKKFVASLNALEGESLRQFTRSFKELSVEEQDKVLTTVSTARASDPTLGTAGGTGPATQTAASSLRDYFEYLKTWVSAAYYSSGVGMKELGWTGENCFESFPGCEHADGHP